MRKVLAPFTALLLAFGFTLVASGGRPVSAASPYPTPAPTAAATALPANIQQAQKLSGCFHNTNGNCPAPSGSGQVADWAYFGTIVNTVETDARAYGLAAQAGIYNYGYVDPVFIHGSITYNGSTSFCPSDTNPLPQNILSKMRDYGEPGLAVNANQTTCSSQNVATLLGDITQPQAASFWQNVYKYNNAILYDGNSYQYPSGVTGVRIDDWLAEFINGPAGGNVICQGPGHLTSTGTVTCSAISGGSSQITADQYPFSQGLSPYIIPDWYIRGSRSFFRAWKQMGLSVVVNNGYDPTTTALVAGQPDHANIRMMQCENCITRNGGSLWGETTWQNHINTEIVLSSQGVGFEAFNVVENSTADQMYTYVSLGLGMMNPNQVWVDEQCGGTIPSATSGVCISPVALVVPTQPLYDPANLNFNPWTIGYNIYGPPSNYGVATLKHNNIYSREFGACYVNQVNIGACAYVLNQASSGGTQTITGLHGTYTHQIVASNNGILTGSGFGDTGSVTYNVSAAPTSLAVGTAAILTP